MATLHVGAFGIADARVKIERRRFAVGRQLERLGAADIPFVVFVQIGGVGGHQIGIGQAGVGVLRGVAGDVQGSLNGAGQRLFGKIGGAGAAFALPQIHGQIQRFVLAVLDLVGFAQPHLHAQSHRFANGGFGSLRALGLSQRQRQRHYVAKVGCCVLEHHGSRVGISTKGRHFNRFQAALRQKRQSGAFAI